MNESRARPVPAKLWLQAIGTICLIDGPRYTVTIVSKLLPSVSTVTSNDVATLSRYQTVWEAVAQPATVVGSVGSSVAPVVSTVSLPPIGKGSADARSSLTGGVTTIASESGPESPSGLLATLPT